MLSILKRECGSCSVCCEVAAVPELAKPALSRCVHAVEDKGGCCWIFGRSDRPKICGKYSCAWLDGLGSDQDRPDRVGAMFSNNVTERGHIGFAVEIQPNAIHTTAKGMAVEFARKFPMPLIVSECGRKTAGEWVILHDKLRAKGAAILGVVMARLSDDVTMYVRREPTEVPD